MSFAVGEPTVLQRAALALHAMPESDRAWLVDALTPAQQRLLEPLLRELRELRLPADPDLVRELVERTPKVPATDWHRLNCLEPEEVRHLAALLACEPPRITAIVLASGRWTWEASLVGALPPGLVLEARRLVRTAPAPLALRRAVAAEVVRRLQSGGSGWAPASRWARLRRALSLRRGT